MFGVAKCWRYHSSKSQSYLARPSLKIKTSQSSRCYAAADAPNSFVHPKLVRSQELVQLAQDLVVKEDWHNVFSLLETALEMQEKYLGDMKGESATTAYFLLAVTYFRLQKYQLSEENFRIAIDNLKSKTDKASQSQLALVYFNFSQLLHVLKKSDEAVHVMEDSIRLSTSVAANGANLNTLHAAQLTNLSIYLISAGRADEARAKSEEALNLAIKDLGRDNQYTRSCFTNYYLILSKLQDNDAIEKLRQKWDSCDKIASDDVKGISAQEFNNIVEELTFSVKKLQPRFIPHGPVKGPTLFKEEILQFVNLWKEKGNPIDESVYSPLEQEVDAIKAGEKIRARLDNALNKQREEYAQKQLNALEQQIEQDLQTTRDRNKKRDIRIFQEETQFTDKLLAETDVPRFLVDRVKPRDHFKERLPVVNDDDDDVDDIYSAIQPDRDGEDQHLLDLLERGGEEGARGGVADQDQYIHKPDEMSEQEWRNYVEQERGLEKEEEDAEGKKKKQQRFDFFEDDDFDYEDEYEQDALYKVEEADEVEEERKNTNNPTKGDEDYEDSTSDDSSPEEK